MNASELDRTFVEKRITRCVDGIVIIENCLSRDEQRRLVNIVEEHGQLFGDNGQPSFSKNRGRVYSILTLTAKTLRGI